METILLSSNGWNFQFCHSSSWCLLGGEISIAQDCLIVHILGCVICTKIGEKSKNRRSVLPRNYQSDLKMGLA